MKKNPRSLSHTHAPVAAPPEGARSIPKPEECSQPLVGSGVGHALQETATPMEAAAWAALFAERVAWWQRWQTQIDRAFGGPPILDDAALAGSREDFANRIARAEQRMRFTAFIDDQIGVCFDRWWETQQLDGGPVHSLDARAAAVPEGKLGEFLKQVIDDGLKGKPDSLELLERLLDVMGLTKVDLLLAKGMLEKADWYPGLEVPRVNDPEAEAAEGKKSAGADHSSAAEGGAVGAGGLPHHRADRARLGKAGNRRAK